MPPVPVSEPAPPKKNHRGALIVGIVAAVVVVLAAVIFGVWWFVLRDDGTNGASTPSSSQTANQTDDDEKSDDVTDPDEEDDKPTKPVTCGIPDATLDTTSLEGDAMVAAFTFDSSACGDGEFSDDDVQVTIKDSDGNVVAAAVYDFSAKPLKFSRGSATAELAFAIGQYWRPFDQIGTGADVVMQPDATSEGDSAAGTSIAMGGANIPSGDVERYSQLAMDWQRGHDRSAANAFYSTYTTQLSSKKYGMEVEGRTWYRNVQPVPEAARPPSQCAADLVGRLPDVHEEQNHRLLRDPVRRRIRHDGGRHRLVFVERIHERRLPRRRSAVARNVTRIGPPSSPRVILLGLPVAQSWATRKHTPATEGPWPNSPKEVGDVCA